MRKEPHSARWRRTFISKPFDLKKARSKEALHWPIALVGPSCTGALPDVRDGMKPGAPAASVYAI